MRATAQGSIRSHPDGPTAGRMTTGAVPVSAMARNWIATSCAACQRSSGSFFRQVVTIDSRVPALVGASDDMADGSPSRMAVSKVVRLAPVNAGRPVAIS